MAEAERLRHRGSACEATLNIAKRPEILELMREAYFVTVFCGIETPDPDALKAMHKDHNMMVPILEGVSTINCYGMEVVSGIIMGLDTDKPETGRAPAQFIEQSQIPLLTINLLQALPKHAAVGPAASGKAAWSEDEDRESNVDFRLPYEHVVSRGASAWRPPMSRPSCSRATSINATTPTPTASSCRRARS